MHMLAPNGHPVAESAFIEIEDAVACRARRRTAIDQEIAGGGVFLVDEAGRR